MLPLKLLSENEKVYLTGNHLSLAKIEETLDADT